MMRRPGPRQIAMAAAGAAAAVALRHVYRGWRAENIAGQVVLITGGSRGLGLSLARAFAAEGCLVAICARNPLELERAQADLERRGAHVLAMECDVSSREQVERMVAAAIRHYGGVDILVNNAGEIQVGPLVNMTLEDFERAMDVMFWGTVYPTMALLPHLMERARGHVVNITSIGGKLSVPHLLPYGCAKFAAVGFSEGLRAELAASGVKVTTIAPGLMRTGSYLNAHFAGRPDRESAWFGLGASLPLLTIGRRGRSSPPPAAAMPSASLGRRPRWRRGSTRCFRALPAAFSGW